AGRGRSREDDRRPLVRRRTSGSRRDLQTVRQFDALRDHRRARRRLRDGQGERRAAERRGRRLRTVQGGHRHRVPGREDGQGRLRRNVRDDDGAQGHAVDARCRRRPAVDRAPVDRGAHGRSDRQRARQRRHGSDCGGGRPMKRRIPARVDVRAILVVLVALLAQPFGAARAQQNANAAANFVKVSAPVVALTHVRVIDGTGAPPREDQTIVMRDGSIAAIGDSGRTPAPSGAAVIDATGKSVVPGLVMLHEHLYYPTGPGIYGNLAISFSRLYLAGGVTTMRTGGNVDGIVDINLSRRIAAGELAGPDIDATAPYVNGENTFLQMHTIRTPDEARAHIRYWADQGATSVKAYMQISRASLKAAIDEAHARRLKVTGHLCSVTYAEAADLGIDNLEHGFMPATDFVADKQPDVCPGQARGQQTIAALDENGAPIKALIRKLVERKVALTSTLTVFETFTPGTPMPPGLDVLTPTLKEAFLRARERANANPASVYKALLPKDMKLERDFARAGGLLVAG